MKWNEVEKIVPDFPFIPETVTGRWERPWHMHPPAGAWRLFMMTCKVRSDVEECTAEALVDLLRGMVDVGQLQPDDVVRDVVLVSPSPEVRRWRVRGWRKAR